MINKPTFFQQFDKVMIAYLGNTLDPFVPCRCGIGNILDNRPEWVVVRNLEFPKRSLPLSRESSNRLYTNAHKSWQIFETISPYTPTEIIRLEDEFLQTLYNNLTEITRDIVEVYKLYTPAIMWIKRDKQFEDALYKAMERFTDVLREIHESWGEVINKPVINRREVVYG